MDSKRNFIYRGGHKSLYPVQIIIIELGKVTYGHPCIVEEYFSSQRSIIVAQRKFRQRFRKQEAPSRKVILRAVTNFRMAGDASKRKSSGRLRTSRNAENCGRVEKALTYM